MRTLASLTALVALSATGCGTCDTGGQKPIEFNGGNSSPSDGSYETSKPFGEYLHFPAGRRFDLMHGLGTAPSIVSAFLSFQRVPGGESDDDNADDDNTGNFAAAAGNQVVFECIDEERVRVRNDTCAESYLRVVLVADGNSSPPVEPCHDVKTD